jgi:hypothetical protein
LIGAYEAIERNEIVLGKIKFKKGTSDSNKTAKRISAKGSSNFGQKQSRVVLRNTILVIMDTD